MTRRLSELRAQCDELGISYSERCSREELANLLRDSLSGSSEELPDPMKARDLSREDLSPYFSPAYVAEPKLDGCRLRLVLGDFSNSAVTGRRSVRTFACSRRDDNFPHLRDALAPDIAGTVLDGELMAPSSCIQTHTGNWTDSLLNASVALVNSGPEGARETQRRFGPAQLHVFDVLRLRGECVMSLSYDQRRELLEQVAARLLELHPDCGVRLVPQLEPSPDVVRQAIEQGYEGVVIKRRSSLYVPSARNGGWFKVKARSTADAFICGYSPGTRGNEGLVGSLELAVMTDQGPRPVAQVANFGAGLRRALTAPNGSLREECLGVVVEFEAQGIGKHGRARSAQLVRIRPDKRPEDCAAEQLELFARV
jgi:ATP-dependent DNA ligase